MQEVSRQSSIFIESVFSYLDGSKRWGCFGMGVQYWFRFCRTVTGSGALSLLFPAAHEPVTHKPVMQFANPHCVLFSSSTGVVASWVSSGMPMAV